uniref:Nuclease associated modular domain-containing protein n=1 Tax=Helianthus annuus TaxID=4232 RepID=A0A251TRH5_HELAN
MPLLDIITPQSPFTNNNNNLYSIGFHSIHHASTARWRRYCHSFTARIQVSRGRMMIRAVATLEPLSTGNKETDNAQQVPAIEPKSSIEDDKELLRRKRISKANKGKEAWNKGVKHSPETRQKIRERTRLAMRRPQVKMKLLKGIHKQTLETRLKIAAAVRLTWDRKRYNRRMIARCHSEWLNLLAEASRKGFCGEEELQWDSYDVINQQLGKEFKEGIESRKRHVGPAQGYEHPKPSSRERKSQRPLLPNGPTLLIAYRDRVYSGIAKQRGKDPEARDPDWGTKKKSPKKVKPVKDRLYDPKARSQRAKVKTSSGPIKVPPQARFKDPHARYKLEMIKSIRAQRAASDPKISEAILRANILIGEAQRAAEALEAAAATSPTAEASLIETRKLIAEAKSYIKSIEMGNSGSAGASFDKEEIVEGVREIEQRGVNGTGSLDIAKFGEEEGLQANVNGVEHVNLSSTATSSSWSDSTLKTKEVKEDGEKQEKGGKRRKWVCGRLVEVDEDGDEDEDEDEDEDKDGDEDEDEVD